MKRIAMLAALAAPALALAAAQLSPGPYDYQVRMEMPGMPFQMPAQSFKQCVTQADIDKGRHYRNKDNQDCETRNLKQSGGKVSFELVCKDGTTGRADYTYTADSLTGKTIMKTGEGQMMTMTMTSKRVGGC